MPGVRLDTYAHDGETELGMTRWASAQPAPGAMPVLISNYLHPALIKADMCDHFRQFVRAVAPRERGHPRSCRRRPMNVFSGACPAARPPAQNTRP
jgi:hypothetical protein